MTEFDSWKAYSGFSFYVERKARHVLDPLNRRFLDAVLSTSEKRKITIPKGSKLWRAQLDSATRIECPEDDEGNKIEFEVPDPFPSARMTPLADRAGEGRVNAKGIPCLYLATHLETAIKEVRPWIGSIVSVALFRVTRDLVVVDCSSMNARTSVFCEEEPDPETREKCVWKQINRAFSRPITRADDLAEYAPTQVLSEHLRDAGYEGILYGSGLDEGKNLALFDLSAAEPTICQVREVTGVEIQHCMAGNSKSYSL